MSNDSAYCRKINIIRHEIPEMIATIDPVNAGFALTDKDDPRYQYFSSLRHRFGDAILRASKVLRQHGDDNTVDAIHILVLFSTDVLAGS